MNRVIARLVLVAGTCCAVDAGATVVVDPAGQGDVTSLQDAIALAADGELVLIKAGSYESAPEGGGFTIVGKGLSLVAEAGAHVSIPYLEVTDLSASQFVVVRGLEIDPSFGNPRPTRPGVEVHGPGGTVWLENCTIRGPKAWTDRGGASSAQPGVRLLKGRLVMQRCTATGGQGLGKLSYGGDGAPGVYVSNADIALQGCTLEGGAGGEGVFSFDSCYGGAGLQLWSGLAFLEGCTATGGTCGETVVPLWNTSLSGDGLSAMSAYSFAWLRDNVFTVGGVAGSGHPGEPVATLVEANVSMLSAPSRSLSISSPLREGEVGALQVSGVLGDQLFLLASPAAGFSQLLGKQGVLALDPPLPVPVALGTISDPDGTLALPFVAPHLAPGVDGLVVLMQLAVLHDGALTLEAGSAFAWLSANF